MTALGLSRKARGRKHIGRESNMTIYISQGRYTAAAIRAMTAKPENRFGCTCRGSWRKPVRHNHDRGTLGRGYCEGFRPGG